MSLKIPEIYILIYSFILNLAWEFPQAPLFVFEQQSTPASLGSCLLFCSAVDAAMTLAAYWSVSLIWRDRRWFVAKGLRRSSLFVGIALLLAFLSEYTAIHYRNLWEYSARMPVIPFAGIGLTPILHWSIVPLLLLMLARR